MILEKLRAKRIKPLLKMVETYYKKYGFVSIIDVGGTKKYWNIVPREFLEKYNVSITCVNLPSPNLQSNDDIFTFENGDGCNLNEYKDKQFHIAHSNSVIEHVGEWDKIVRFSNEIKRIADSYFVQTPNFWFPLEPHWFLPFFHWLPRPIECWFLTHVSPLNNLNKCKNIDEAMRRRDSARLLSKAMFKWLFPEGTIVTERYCLLPKSFCTIYIHSINDNVYTIES